MIPAHEVSPSSPPDRASPAPSPEAAPAAPAALQPLVRGHGTSAGPLPGESEDRYENRLATGLMALFRDTGRAEAFEALYALARPSVLRWIQALLRKGQSSLDPAEVLQDTFVNVYRYPASFRDEHEGSFRVWVRTIAGNLIRRRSARPPRRLSFQELPDGLQEPEDAREDPLAQALVDEEQARLRGAWMLFLGHYARAWEDLGQRDRRTLHLVEVEGLSYQEAGEVLGVGRSNMKMIVFRSRRRIARRMRQTMAQALALAPHAGPDARAEAGWSPASGAA